MGKLHCFPPSKKKAGQWTQHVVATTRAHRKSEIRYAKEDAFPCWMGRPACEQRALSPVSLLPADCPVCVLPGDKLFQPDTLSEGFINPVIFQYSSGNKDKKGKELEKAATKDLMPLAACLLGASQWQHPSGSTFVVGTKWIARQKLGRLSIKDQLNALLQAWWR